jgi:hypothetical protein
VSSSVVISTPIGPDDALWCLREAETHVGSFSEVETKSNTSSMGRSIVTALFHTHCTSYIPIPAFPGCAYYITHEVPELSRRQPRTPNVVIHPTTSKFEILDISLTAWLRNALETVGL